MADTENPIDILRSAFTARSLKNPRYSLRAFAKSLGMSHTILSLVLSGKRPLSQRAAKLISQGLGLDPQQARRFINHRTPEPMSTETATSSTTSRDYQKIEMDVFQLISDWVHYGILSLVEVEKGILTPKQIAKRLGINETKAKLCLERLIDLKMLAREDQRYLLTGLPIKVENSISTAASKTFQRQLLEKAIESLDNDSFDIRDHSSMTMAIDPKHIPYARERIRKFRRELTEELESKGSATEVYNLTVQIYPVSKRTSK